MFYEKLLKFLHWEKREKPEVDLSAEIWEELKPFRAPTILTLLITLFGTLGYILIDNFSLMDALYQTGITFTTVGFGEISPISNAGRLFTIFLIVAGFAVFSYSVGIIVEVINKGRLVALIKENRMLYKIARLKNHVVVCYHNEYTIELTKELRKAHIPFVVVASDENLEEIARKHKYPFFIKAEPHTLLALKKSHLSSAKGVITLSKNVPDNIAIISSVRLYEKDLKRTPYHIIALASQEEEIEKLQRLGADEVLSPTKLIAKRMTAITVDPDISNLLEEFIYSTETPLDLEKIVIRKNSWIANKKLKDTYLRDIFNIDVIGIQEENGEFISLPKGNTILRPNDILIVVGNSKDIKNAKSILEKTTEPDIMNLLKEKEMHL